MELKELLHPRNPRTELVWKYASGEHDLQKKKGTRSYRETLCMDVCGLCEDLMEGIGSQRQPLNSQTFYRASMVTSGALRVLNRQTEVLLDDVKKLLGTMNKEKITMEKFDEKLDCVVHPGKALEQTTIIEQIDREQHDIFSPRATVRRGPAAASAKVIPLDFTTLDGEFDWSVGQPRARMEDITLPDLDAQPSVEFMREVERLGGEMRPFDGPTLLDWESSREGSPTKETDKTTDVITTEAPNLPIIPEEEQPMDTVIPDEISAILPSIVVETSDEPQISTEVQPPTERTPEEHPSQIELEPLRDALRQQRRRRARVVPTVDPVIIQSTDYMRMQMTTSDETQRVLQASDDIINVTELRFHESDFFGPAPLRSTVMAEKLLKMFERRHNLFPLPGTHEMDILRIASHTDERGNISALTTILQDPTEQSIETSDLHRSSTIEQITEENITDVIRGREGGAGLSPLPELPDVVTPAPDVEETPRRRPRKRSKVDKDAASPPSLVPSTSVIEAAREPSPQAIMQEDLPPQAEAEQSTSSESIEGTTIEYGDLVRNILDYLTAHPSVSFLDLLREDPSDRNASLLFDCLLQMHKDNKLKMKQKVLFGSITVNKV